MAALTMSEENIGGTFISTLTTNNPTYQMVLLQKMEGLQIGIMPITAAIQPTWNSDKKVTEYLGLCALTTIRTDQMGNFILGIQGDMFAKHWSGSYVDYSDLSLTVYNRGCDVVIGKISHIESLTLIPAGPNIFKGTYEPLMRVYLAWVNAMRSGKPISSRLPTIAESMASPFCSSGATSTALAQRAKPLPPLPARSTTSSSCSSSSSDEALEGGFKPSTSSIPSYMRNPLLEKAWIGYDLIPGTHTLTLASREPNNLLAIASTYSKTHGIHIQPIAFSNRSTWQKNDWGGPGSDERDVQDLRNNHLVSFSIDAKGDYSLIVCRHRYDVCARQDGSEQAFLKNILDRKVKLYYSGKKLVKIGTVSTISKWKETGVKAREIYDCYVDACRRGAWTFPEAAKPKERVATLKPMMNL